MPGQNPRTFIDAWTRSTYFHWCLDKIRALSLMPGQDLRTFIDAWTRPTHFHWCLGKIYVLSLMLGQDPRTFIDAWARSTHFHWCLDKIYAISLMLGQYPHILFDAWTWSSILAKVSSEVETVRGTSIGGMCSRFLRFKKCYQLICYFIQYYSALNVLIYMTIKMLNLSLQYSFDEYKIWRVSVTRLFTSVSPPEYTGARSCTLYTLQHGRRNRQNRRQRSSLLFGGGILSITCRTYRFSPRLIMRKGWIEERTLVRTWRLEKNVWSSGSHHTKPPPSQNRCSSKNLS